MWIYVKLTCPYVTIDVWFISSQFGYSGCEVGASNKLQWQKTHLCIMHRGDDRHLHDRQPVNVFKRDNARQLNEEKTIRFYEGWWTMGVVEDGDEGLKIWSSSPLRPSWPWNRPSWSGLSGFDTPIWIFSVVSESDNYLMLFYDVWCVGRGIDVL